MLFLIALFRNQNSFADSPALLSLLMILTLRIRNFNNRPLHPGFFKPEKYTISEMAAGCNQCLSSISVSLFLLLKISRKLRLDFLNGRQNGFQVVRQGPGQLVFGDADGFVQFPLAERFVQGQEIKDIGVFQGVFGELRMRFRQLHVEISYRRALPVVGIGLDGRR